MRMTATKLSGVVLIQPVRHSDERGYLVRTHCVEAFEAAGLNTVWVQCSVTSSPIKGTLRGMHYQTAPFGEIKLIRCLTGSVWDCLVDVRPTSPTFGKWEAFELTEENALALYVPEGIAHGFLTLTPEVRMLYSMSRPFSPLHTSGVRWNDSMLSIDWPEPPSLISEKDQNLPNLIMHNRVAQMPGQS